MLFASVQECCKCLVVVVVGFFQYFAIANHNEIISNNLNSSESLKELVHLALKHIWGRADAKGNSLPTVTAKRGVEGCEVR